MAYTYSKIATYTVGSGGVPSVSFLNIPQTYTDLVLKFSLREATTNNGVAKLTFNGSASGYTARMLWGNGSSVGSSTNYTGSGTYFGGEGTSAGSGNTANTFANAEFYIPNYTSSNNKSLSLDGVSETNATAIFMGLSAGLWSNTSPINSITLIEYAGGNWAQHSTFHLYGIKAEL